MAPAAVVTIRSPRPDDLEVLLRADLADESSMGERDVEARRAELAERIERDPDRQTEGIWFWTVEADGSPVGDIQIRAPRYAWPPGVCGVGLSLLPEVRGRGIGTAALDHACRRLAGLGWARVQGETALDNQAMRRVFERCGFVREGTLHGFTPGPDGRRDDVAAYGRVLETS